MKGITWKFLPPYDAIFTLDVPIMSKSKRYEKLYGIKRNEGETEEEHVFRVDNGYEERQILIKHFKERGYDVE